MMELFLSLYDALRSLSGWGHLLTFLGSVLTTTLFFARYIATSRAEIRRLRLEVKNQYAEDLLAARLSCYKECYSILSEFAKVSLGYRDEHGRSSNHNQKNHYRPVSFDQLVALSKQLGDWDSAHALLLSADAAHRLFHLRALIREWMVILRDDNSALSEEEYSMLWDRVAEVEIALKADVGVFAVDEYLSLTRPKSYAEVEKKLTSLPLKTAKANA